ncbi:hypothetical protein FOZ61_000272 [Perkinsus olseni]|uniref:Uncharacterized protein n=1 Tax=Perkinsus olseni TaxID=32597 RepID=A0A7J6M0G9_PEROL|nr:hypothetical protein FOZ61_000272 [Perkinsus olseni]
MQSALNWCISACRCPWQWTQGSSNYTDLDLAADSGRLDRRALLEDNGLARSSSTASSPDTRRYQPRRPACEGISYGSAVLEEGDAGAASNSLEAFVPANEVPPVVENGGEEAGRRRRPLIEHNEGTIPLVNHIVEPVMSDKKDEGDAAEAAAAAAAPAGQGGRRRRRRRKNRAQRGS